MAVSFRTKLGDCTYKWPPDRLLASDISAAYWRTEEESADYFEFDKRRFATPWPTRPRCDWL